MFQTCVLADEMMLTALPTALVTFPGDASKLVNSLVGGEYFLPRKLK